jgi:hypothetical protein
VLVVLGQRSVDAGQARVLPFAFAGGDDQVRSDVLDGLAACAAAEHGVQHVVGDHRGSAAVVALAGGCVESFEGGLADVLAFGFGHRGEEREQDAAGSAGVVDAGQRSGEHLQGDAVGGEVVGERGQLGGVAAQPLHLVDGEDDAAVWCVGLDLAAHLQRGLELWPHPDAGGDLLGEDLVAADAVRFQGVELGLEFLGQVRAAGVADPDVGGRGVRRKRRRRRAARPPQLPWSPIGWRRYPQPLRQPGHLHEPAGVVGPGDRAGARPAWRARLDPAPRAWVALDFVGIGGGGGRFATHPGTSHKPLP